MQPGELQKTIGEIYRVLRTGGIFTLVDFYQPANPMFIRFLWLFLWLFETGTAWKFLQLDLAALLREIGFQVNEPE